MLGVALIGAGRVAAAHTAAFGRVADADIRAVADPRRVAAESLAQALGAKAFIDYRRVLALPEVDIVDIAVPHALHAEIASAALEAGKHVFMDKPLATTLADGERLCALAARSDRVMMICHNLLFHPVVAEGMSAVEAGVLGRPTVADAWSCGYLDLSPWDFRRSQRATGGGAWFDGAPHLLYTFEHLLGPIDDVVARLGAGPSRIGGEDNAAAAVRFRNGATATLRVSYADKLPGHDEPWPTGWKLGFELRGTGGTLSLTVLPTPSLTMYTGQDTPSVRHVDGTFQASFDGAIVEFVTAIREQRVPTVPLSASLRTLRQVLSAAQTDTPSTGHEGRARAG